MMTLAERQRARAAVARDGRLSLRPLGTVLLVHLLAVAALFRPSWPGVWMLVAGHFLTGCLGVSVGYHRLLAHRSFDAPPAVRGLLALLGTLSLQTGPLSWAALHRAHHRHSDGSKDPHASTRGFLFSHVRWIAYSAPNGFSYLEQRSVVRDLGRSRWLRFLESHFVALNLGAFALSWWIAGLDVTLWAFPLRLVLVWHGTWLVNSLGHGALGKRREPTNVPWAVLLSYGENWHANHHRRQSAVSFAQRRGQIDLGYWSVRCLAALGLASLRKAHS